MSMASHQRAPRRPFTPEEDEQLRQLVAANGEDWPTVALRMPDRTARQCHERWLHYVSPGIASTPWTADEEAIIEDKVKEYGQQWKFMERYLPGRRDSHIKNHYKVIVRRRAKEQKRALGLPLKTRRRAPETPPGVWDGGFDIFSLDCQFYEAFE
jgi:hypothetical protein